MKLFKIFILFLLLANLCFGQDSEEEFLNGLYNQLDNATSDSIKVDAYIALGRYYISRDYNEVDQYLHKAKRIIRGATYDTRDHEARFIRQTGILYRKRSNNSMALKHYLEAMKIAEELKDSNQISSDFTNIGVLYAAELEYDKAIFYLKKAALLRTKLKAYQAVGRNYRSIATLFEKKKELDSTQYYIDLARSYFLRINDQNWITELKSVESKLYQKKGDYDTAIQLLNQFLDHVMKHKKISKILGSYSNLSLLYKDKKDYKMALVYINKTIDLAKEYDSKSFELESYKIRSELHELMGNKDQAIIDFRNYDQLSNRIYNLNKTKELKEIELYHKFDKIQLLDSLNFEQERKTLNLIAEKAKVKNKYYFSLVILAILIGGIAIYYFRILWLKAKRMQEELKSRLKIKNKENKKRIEDLNLDINQLSDQIQAKKTEIAQLMTESLQHLKNKERLVDDLKKVAANDGELSLKSIIADLNSEAIDDHRLKLIKSHLEELNFDYFNKLKTNYPELTKVDLEICSYLKLGFGRKEIAKLRNTTTDAVKKSRYRIRKKMQLDSGIDLETYLKQL